MCEWVRIGRMGDVTVTNGQSDTCDKYHVPGGCCANKWTCGHVWVSILSLSYSLTHDHRSIGYRNIPQSLTDSVTRLIYLRVYDNRTNSSKPSPSPSSLSYSLTHTHNIHTLTLPTPTLLTFTCTQVLWFLESLTRSRTSGVTTRPTTRLTVFFTHGTEYVRDV